MSAGSVFKHTGSILVSPNVPQLAKQSAGGNGSVNIRGKMSPSSINSLIDRSKLIGLKVGVSLCQLGEFGFVFSSHAHMEGLITTDMHRTLLGATAVSLLLTPFVMRFALKYLIKYFFKIDIHNHTN